MDIAVWALGAILIAAWIYVLYLLNKSQLRFWHYIVGAIGLFLILMVFVRPWTTQPLADTVAAISGIIGYLTGTFQAYFKYGVIFIDSAQGSMTLQIDFECSGIIEIIAFISLIAFYRVYSKNERVLYGVLGTLFIILANVIRITVISEIIYFGGPTSYYISHSLIGRLIFYVLTILMYFYVFTKPHIKRMKVGAFTYGADS